MKEIQKVTQAEMERVIGNRQPRGLFYRKAGRRLYVGVDNSTGDAWTEEFHSWRHCKRWLLDPSIEPPGCG